MGADLHAVVVLDQVGDLLRVDGDAGPLDRGEQSALQGRAAHAYPGRAGEPGLGPMPLRDVGDAAERATVQFDPKVVQSLDRGRHQPLAAGLVHRGRAGFEDVHVQAGPGRVQRRGQADRSGPDHDDVGHD